MRTAKKNAAQIPVLKKIARNILRVQYTPPGSQPRQSALIADEFAPSPAKAEIHFAQRNGCIQFTGKTGELLLEETGHMLEPKPTYRYTVDGTPIFGINTRPTARWPISENAQQIPGESAYHGKLTFQISAGECLYGLGQHENGVYNYRGHTETMHQTNMKISIPFLISSANYGLLIDTESAMVFSEQDGVMRFELETTAELQYYVIAGENFRRDHRLAARAHRPRAHAAALGVRLHPIQGTVPFGTGAAGGGGQIPGAWHSGGLPGAGLAYLGRGALGRKARRPETLPGFEGAGGRAARGARTADGFHLAEHGSGGRELRRISGARAAAAQLLHV